MEGRVCEELAVTGLSSQPPAEDFQLSPEAEREGTGYALEPPREHSPAGNLILNFWTPEL